MRSVSANLPRNELGEEDNLLVEAVSLLVQRQRETEKWVAEQVLQAEERTAATERRYAELAARLADVEEQLARVAHEVGPLRGDSAADERLARLRAHLEALKSGGNGVPAGIGSPAPRSASDALKVAPVRGPEAARAPLRARAEAPSRGQGVTLLDLLGSSPQDRFGLVFIGVGGVAVLYALLSLLRGG